ncbi:TlpA family protein disulfide reductase [Nocardioides pacificus]
MRRPLPTALVAVVLGLTLSACAPGDDDDKPGWSVPSVGPAEVEVDTPELREAKASLGVEPCVPGAGAPGAGSLPEVTLECLGGGEAVDLSRLEGPLIINWWAQWCEPCRTEMPILQSFHERYGDRAPILGIDSQDNRPQWAFDLIEETGATYPMLADPGGDTNRAGDLQVRGLPHFAFLSADGELTQVAVSLTSEEQLVELVAEHLGIDL